MKNIDFTKVRQLFRLFVAEERHAIFVIPFKLVVTLVLFGWFFYYRYDNGDFALINGLLLPICIYFPTTKLFKDFLTSRSGHAPMLVPMTSFEKYLTLWSVSLMAVVYCLLVTLPLVGLLLGVVLHLFHDLAYSAYISSYLAGFDLRMADFGLMLTTGGVLYHLARLQHTRLQRFLPRFVFVLSLAWFFIVPMFPVGNPLELFALSYDIMIIISLPCAVLYLVWGYRLFSRAELDKH